MERGYILLHRKLLDSAVWQNPNAFRVWTWCLLKASHDRYIATVGNQSVELLPGQFITGRLAASKETGLSERVFRDSLSVLQKASSLTIKTTSRFSVITICNWARYQVVNGVTEPAECPAECPAEGQQKATNNNTLSYMKNPVLREVHEEERVVCGPPLDAESRSSVPTSESVIVEKHEYTITFANLVRLCGIRLQPWWEDEVNAAFALGATLGEAKTVFQSDRKLARNPQKLCDAIIAHHEKEHAKRTSTGVSPGFDVNGVPLDFDKYRHFVPVGPVQGRLAEPDAGAK